ncbi:MAG: prolipoprotein diacylglyceryl transferase [Candidatus Lambdaproteobacteria bacterium RIFOXYD2_FULL_50_16]|uniref:Phosphatidylglycerol--prolipoprotein diacylglyceryl transferase n=1 Tax=Candidatus Lambdaproteobacteria bacterium RIFOXYD2_FULL_50_16 TaxID=1817772 RepID=A0A1F6G4T4_9PROT|nr:MAG: prolipoprotein diacylglyceryl transferase [Candidatus Lambdaproteobacteria bacterium RIFOXYD2_FULL_50_16]
MNPVFLEIGSLQIRYYGLMYAMGILAAYFLIKRDLSWAKAQVDADEMFNLIIYTFLGAILGARAYYVLFNLDYYFGEKVPWYEFVAVWHGGLAIHGGLVTGPLTLFLVCHFRKYPFGRISDLFAPTLLLAQALGRVGNFMNGDAHGIPTDLAWGVVFPYGPAAHEFPGIPLHPVMFYEAILDVLGFALLYSIRKKHFRPGFISALYVVIYGVIRFVASFFRADDLYFMGLRAPHVVSILGIIGALAVILVLRLFEQEKAPAPKKEQQFLPKRQWKM